MSDLQISFLETADIDGWSEVVQTSPNSTIFHDLRFLGYHPKGRFRFAHLIVRRGDQIAAVIPGSLVSVDGGTQFRSPAGASVGGPAFRQSPSLELAIDTIAALQRFAEDQGLNSISLTLPPTIYEREPRDTLAFALHHHHFTLETRQLCFVLPLRDRSPETLFHKGALQRLNAARRDELEVRMGGVELLSAFSPLFTETYERHETTATHSVSELEYILRTLPERAKLCVAFCEDIPVAGLLVFSVARNAATTFYTCSTRSHSSGSRGLILAFATAIADARAANLEFLDLGPSASSTHVNDGVVVFKEGLGAQGQARDTWLWVRPEGYRP